RSGTGRVRAFVDETPAGGRLPVADRTAVARRRARGHVRVAQRRTRARRGGGERAPARRARPVRASNAVRLAVGRRGGAPCRGEGAGVPQLFGEARGD